MPKASPDYEGLAQAARAIAGRERKLTVRVYTQPNCPQCNATKARLDKLHIPYVTQELTDDDRAAAVELGITSAPVVCAETAPNIAGQQWWGGYRPDRIDALQALL